MSNIATAKKHLNCWLLHDLLIIWFVVWYVKRHKMVENVNQCFLKHKMTSNVLFYPQPKDYSITRDENQLGIHLLF